MATVEISEKQLNEICAHIAALYSLKLKKMRPIKIDNGIDCFAKAGEPTMLFNVSLHRSVKEMGDTIKHELIHYELADSGKYAGHGDDFKKRAKQLGILGTMERVQCLEQLDIRRHRTEIKENPVPSNQRTTRRQYQASSSISTMDEKKMAEEFERVVGECRTQKEFLQRIMSERRLLIRDRNRLRSEFHQFKAGRAEYGNLSDNTWNVPTDEWVAGRRRSGGKNQPGSRAMSILRHDYIERRLDVAMHRFRETRDLRAKREIEWWSVLLADQRNVAVLESALLKRHDAGLMRNEVRAALLYLENRAALKWPFKHFRDALKMENHGGRWLMLRASLIEIRMALGMDPEDAHK